jgi:7-keto-8-aminopelargonate synthetase-like enzyme
MFFLCKFVTKLILLVLRGDEQGLGVKINRIVLQTLTFTSGALGIAPANHGSILLSDSRHGNYLINKTRSLILTTTLSPLFFSSYFSPGYFYPNEF